MPGLGIDLGDVLLVLRIADDEAVLMAVLRHPLAFRLLHHLVVHAPVLPVAGDDVHAQTGLMIAGAGLGDPSVILAVVPFQPPAVHGFLRRVGAVGALQIHVPEAHVLGKRADFRVHVAQRLDAFGLQPVPLLRRV